MTCKIFADIERLKVREREKMAEEKLVALIFILFF